MPRKGNDASLPHLSYYCDNCGDEDFLLVTPETEIPVLDEDGNLIYYCYQEDSYTSVNPDEVDFHNAWRK